MASTQVEATDLISGGVQKMPMASFGRPNPLLSGARPPPPLGRFNLCDLSSRFGTNVQN